MVPTRRLLRHLAALALWWSASTASAAGPDTIPVPDAALGLPEGRLPILSGWHGTARVDRTSDPLAGGTAIVAVDVASPDGTSRLRGLPVAFHTYAPSPAVNLMLKPQLPGAALMFRSTADLLVRQILPRLALPGEASAPFAIDADKLSKVASRQAAFGVPDVIVDAAAVVVRDAASGRETLVGALTIGGARGSPNEMTTTFVSLLDTPAGESRALHERLARLPDFEPDPAWRQADQALADRRLAQMRQQSQAAYSQNMANQNATFAAWQQRSAAQRAQYDQYNAAQARRRTATSDSAALFSGYVGDHSVTYKWCNGGAVRYVTDSLQSPGAGYQRC